MDELPAAAAQLPSPRPPSSRGAEVVVAAAAVLEWDQLVIIIPRANITVKSPCITWVLLEITRWLKETLEWMRRRLWERVTSWTRSPHRRHRHRRHLNIILMLMLIVR